MKGQRFKVESNVDMPALRCKLTEYPFMDMKRGDSFLVPCEPEHATRVRSRLWAAGKAFGKQNNGCRFITRLVQGGVRCWRYE